MWNGLAKWWLSNCRRPSSINPKPSRPRWVPLIFLWSSRRIWWLPRCYVPVFLSIRVSSMSLMGQTMPLCQRSACIWTVSILRLVFIRNILPPPALRARPCLLSTPCWLRVAVWQQPLRHCCRPASPSRFMCAVSLLLPRVSRSSRKPCPRTVLYGVPLLTRAWTNRSILFPVLVTAATSALVRSCRAFAR